MNKYHIDYHYFDSPSYYGDTLFIQLGRLWFSRSGIMPKHVHADLFELTAVTEGKGIIYTNGVATEVSRGDIYLSYPGDFHEIQTDPDEPMKYDFFAFNTRNEKLKDELEGIVSSYGYDSRVFRDEAVSSVISTAIAEYSSKQAYRDEMLSLLFEEIIYYTVRNFTNDAPKRQSKYTVSADELCYQMMHYIDTNIYGIEDLSVLSQKLNYNYSYLSDLFKRTTGNTLSDYYRTRRMDTALLLLQEGRLSVNKIAEMLRYSTPGSFSKAFKKRYGISPGRYKS